MPKIRPKPAPPSGLDASQRAELRRLLDCIPAFDPLPVRDIGGEASPALLEALEYTFGCGLKTGIGLRAYPCRGGSWVIDSRIMDDLHKGLER
jgi:hypothetical protein